MFAAFCLSFWLSFELLFPWFLPASSALLYEPFAGNSLYELLFLQLIFSVKSFLNIKLFFFTNVSICFIICSGDNFGSFCSNSKGKESPTAFNFLNKSGTDDSNFSILSFAPSGKITVEGTNSLIVGSLIFSIGIFSFFFSSSIFFRSFPTKSNLRFFFRLPNIIFAFLIAQTMSKRLHFTNFSNFGFSGISFPLASNLGWGVLEPDLPSLGPFSFALL